MFNHLVFNLGPDPGVIPSSGPQRDRAIELLNWAEGPGGPGFNEVVKQFAIVVGVSVENYSYLLVTTNAPAVSQPSYTGFLTADEYQIILSFLSKYCDVYMLQEIWAVLANGSVMPTTYHDFLIEIIRLKKVAGLIQILTTRLPGEATTYFWNTIACPVGLGLRKE